MERLEINLRSKTEIGFGFDICFIVRIDEDPDFNLTLERAYLKMLHIPKSNTHRKFKGIAEIHPLKKKGN